MCLSKNKGYKLLKVSLTKGTVYTICCKLKTTNFKLKKRLSLCDKPFL